MIIDGVKSLFFEEDKSVLSSRANTNLGVIELSKKSHKRLNL